MSIASRFRFSGRISPGDPFHQVTAAATGAAAPDEHYLAPITVKVTITNPPPQHVIGVPQYSPAVNGGTTGYDPAGDCGGAFMSYKFQSNNNCYAYGCNIAANSFPQPGRASGNLLSPSTIDGPTVQSFAEKDGLIFVGNTKGALTSFSGTRAASAGGSLDGHFVALMISPQGDANWPGDYHWARCDDNVNFASWSQKDGTDQVTNFDFAGNLITDPATANWTVNQGPVSSQDTRDLIVDYQFYCYMYVPNSGVNII